MKKLSVLFIITLFTSNTFSQDCGFETNESFKATIDKIEWFERKLNKEKLNITNDKNDIPSIVLNQLNCYTKNFDIANPNEEHQTDCSYEEGIPSRHLILLAKNEKYLIINYNTYNVGIAGHFIWIKYDENGITDFLSGSTMGGFVANREFDLHNYVKETSEFTKNMINYLNEN